MSFARKQHGNEKHFFVKSTFEIEEFIKCKKSILYFINNYVKIYHPIKGKIPFKLFPFQMALLKIYLLHRYNVTLKPRQMGISTLVCAYALWLAIFHPYKVIALISIKASVARNLIRKIKFMYESLPDFLKMEFTNGNGKGTADSLIWSNGSQIYAEAATENAGRSDALSCLIMDEVAFQRYASGIWASAQPTLSTGGQAILLSSAFGMGNFFHETYTNAAVGQNGFFPVRLKWEMHPERNIEWYKQQLRMLGVKRVAQEIDCDFLQSGFTVFDMTKIKAIEDRLNDKVLLGSYMHDKLKVYHDYNPTEQCYIGADIALGRGRGHDFSAFSIMNHRGKELACFKGKINTREFAYTLMKWGEKYGNAVLAPEANAMGESVVSHIQENAYPNLYTSVAKVLRADEYDREESNVFGWLTTGKSRHTMISGMDDDLQDELVEINNPFFVEEAYTFIYNSNNKAIASGKGGGKTQADNLYEDEVTGAVYTDDAILGACITNEVRKDPAKYRGDLPISAGS